jgi:hypothetical protein
VSGGPETAPIAPPSCRPRPPARLRHPLAPLGLAPSPVPLFGFSATSGRFYRPQPRPSIYKTPLVLFAALSTHFLFFFLSEPLFLGPHQLARTGLPPDASPLSFPPEMLLDPPLSRFWPALPATRVGPLQVDASRSRSPRHLM